MSFFQPILDDTSKKKYGQLHLMNFEGVNIESKLSNYKGATSCGYFPQFTRLPAICLPLHLRKPKIKRFALQMNQIIYFTVVVFFCFRGCQFSGWSFNVA